MSNPSINQARATNGEFGTMPHAETSTTLPSPAPRPTRMTVGISAVVDLDLQDIGELPAWPAQLPEPDVSYAWDDEDDLEVTLTFGDDTLTVWGPTYELRNSFVEMPAEYNHIPAAVQRQAAEYGCQLAVNLGDLTNQTRYAAHTPTVRAELIALATTGREVPYVSLDDPAWVAPAVAATARAETNLKAWFGARDVEESTIQDVLTDLFHYANAHGIKPTQIGNVINAAERAARDELENPEG